MNNDLIGQILIEQGVMTTAQVQEALQAQYGTDKPLGQIAQDLFGISAMSVAMALAEQIGLRSPHTSLASEHFDPQCLSLITARDAWDRLILPIRWEDGELLCATTVETLPVAIELLQAKLDCPFHFVIAEMRPLEEFIASLYAYEGVEVVD